MRTHNIETRSLVETPTAAVFATMAVEELGIWIPQALEQVAMYLGRLGLGPVGMPYVRYHPSEPGTFEVEAGFPATGPCPESDGVRPSALPGGPAACLLYTGPYESMGNAYEALSGWLAAEGKEPDGDMWEVYLSDPDQEPDPTRWQTEIYQPYR